MYTPGVKTTTCGWRTPSRSSDANETQQPTKLLGVVVDGKDRLPLEQVGECPLGDRPVLQQIAGARRHPQVVLEHVDDTVGIAHEIAAADVRPHPELRRHAHALGTQVDRVLQQLVGEDTIGDDTTIVIDVVDEPIERGQSLLQPLFDTSPLRRADHPRHDVHRPGTIRALAVVVDGERDAEGNDVDLGKALPLLQFLDVQRSQALDECCRGRSGIAMSIDQLVPQKRDRAQVGHWSNHAT